MDSALLLKQKYDSREITNYNQAIELLDKSKILKKLLSDFEFDILNLLNRLVEISEIPFTYRIKKVKNWLDKLVTLSYCGDGFSFSGKSDDILSCYNSMIISTLIRMHYQDIEKIRIGINWILNYQNVERNKENKWKGSRILKYGGCMKNIPCYIGLVKAIIALTDFKNMSNYQPDSLLEKKLNSGLQYILNHQVYKKQSTGEPITKDILKLNYPFSYKTNIIEILRLLKANNMDKDSRCDSAKKFIWSKRHKGEFWKTNSLYLPKYWIPFDKTKEPALWMSYEIENLLN